MSLRRWAHWTAPASLALIGHAGLFAAMGHVRRAQLPVPALDASGGVQPSEIALEIERETPPSPARASDDGPSTSTGTPRLAPRAPHAGAYAARESSAPTTEQGPAGPGAAAGEPAPAGSADDGWSFSPTRSADVTAPGFVAKSVRDIVQEGTTTGTGGAAGGLSDALDQRDVDLGMGRGGPVLAALETASRGMDVPIEGAATFDVAIDAAGRVSVALSDVSNEYAAWSKVASAAGAAVDAKRVRIPPGARGWHVVVRIDAHVQYPNGLKPRQLGTHFEASPGQISKTSMVMDKLPGFTISTRGKVCGIGLSVQMGVPSIAGGCDPENAGMPAGRVVAGHIVSEGRL